MLARYLSKPLQKEIVAERLAKVYKRIETLPCSNRAFLFGSAARNEMDEFSDIDIYVIFKNRDELKKSSRFLYSASVDFGFPMDWVLTTEDEHRHRATIGGLAFDIEKDGLLFFERVTI